MCDLGGMGRFYKGEVVEYDAKKKKHKVGPGLQVSWMGGLVVGLWPCSFR